MFNAAELHRVISLTKSGRRTVVTSAAREGGRGDTFVSGSGFQLRAKIHELLQKMHAKLEERWLRSITDPGLAGNFAPPIAGVDD